MKFFKCPVCGKTIMSDSNPDAPVCCGSPMEELVAGTTDAAKEKHVPVYSVENGAVGVTVGSVEHPMLDNHYIEWIAVETNKGHQLKNLKPGDAPKASFLLSDGEEVISVYAYCNLHSLWKA